MAIRAGPTIVLVPRVLILARHFPPMGGAGVHRTLGSVRHLPAFGYEPTLVTGPARETPRNRWEPTDAGLLARLPAGARIERVPDTQPETDLSRIDRLLLRRSPLASWWIEESVRLACEVGRDADVVLTSCAPYEAAFAGARVAEELGLPWIADLEDPWALDEMRVPFSAVHRAVDLRRMRRALATASAVVMAAPEAAERVRRTMPELAGRVVTGIPIGYEPSDFPARVPVSTDGVFRIVHTGTMHTDFGEQLRRTRLRRRLAGGSFPGLDALTRSHVFLVRAIARAIAADPSLEGRVELHLAGDLTDADRAVAEGHSFVRMPGLQPHDATVALMRSADLLFLPMHDLPDGARAGLIPYKTFEYLAAGRPILAAVPDGDVRDMLGRLPQATVVRPADVDAMAEAVRRRVAAAAAAPGGREPDVVPPLEYERHECVSRIAAVLDEVVAVSRPAALAAA
jgi:glycosyltransferase involved in cell wall biosynthesis